MNPKNKKQIWESFYGLGFENLQTFVPLGGKKRLLQQVHQIQFNYGSCKKCFYQCYYLPHVHRVLVLRF